MKNKNTTLVLFLIVSLLQSCLVPLASKTHFFSLVDSTEKSSPKLQIFSTPKYKSYVVTNMDMSTEVFIQSPVFENPKEFYLMKTQPFFETEAKQFEIQKRDRRFYQTGDYKNVTLKIVSKGDEKTIVYKLAKN